MTDWVLLDWFGFFRSRVIWTLSFSISIVRRRRDIFCKLARWNDAAAPIAGMPQTQESRPEGRLSMLGDWLIPS